MLYLPQINERLKESKKKLFIELKEELYKILNTIAPQPVAFPTTDLANVSGLAFDEL